MEIREAISKIIEAGIRAPSGDNCQPWRFEVKDNRISIYNIPDRDNSLYSWGQRASYIAHGALIENMTIAAAHLGYAAKIKLFPESRDPNLVARLTLEQPAPPEEGALYEAIFARATNRKPYRKTPLDPEQVQQLLNVSREVSGVRVHLVQDETSKRELGNAAAMNEKVLFENQGMHSFLFGHLNWSDKEDEEKKIGFSIKTFELPPPVQAAFRVFKNWKALQWLNKIGLSKMIPKTNGAINAKAGAFAAVAVPDTTPESYIAAGRAFERIWLKVTAMGLQMQPLTGILFLARRVEANEIKDLAPEHVQLIQAEHEKINQAFGGGDTVAMMCRIGRGEKPTARTHRLPPDIRGL